VKTSFLIVVLLLSLSLANAQGRAATAGQIALRKYESSHQVEAPPQPQRRSTNVQLQHDADELSSLAQSIPAGLKLVTQGTLPKDLLERLKKIEKLSKHLRSELGQ
jgi:predicted outer membrane protein